MDGFIYPQWMTAKRKLIEALVLDRPQHKILDDWFKNFIFEFGLDQSVNKYELKEYKNEPKFKKYLEDQAAHMLASEMIRKQVYMRSETFDGQGNLRIRTTMLVCAVPFLVGPAEHKPTPDKEREK